MNILLSNIVRTSANHKFLTYFVICENICYMTNITTYLSFIVIWYFRSFGTFEVEIVKLTLMVILKKKKKYIRIQFQIIWYYARANCPFSLKKMVTYVALSRSALSEWDIVHLLRNKLDNQQDGTTFHFPVVASYYVDTCQLTGSSSSLTSVKVFST